MTEFIHIVRIYPMLNGEADKLWIKANFEVLNREDAELFVEQYNNNPDHELRERFGEETKAVYLGSVNYETGEWR